MRGRDIVVAQAFNKKHRGAQPLDASDRRGGIEIQLVAHACIPEPAGHENTRHNVPERWRPREARDDAVFGNPSQAREGALGHYGTEGGPFGGCLNQDRGAHRFTQAEDLPAACRAQPAGPLDHVPFLDHAIGCGLAAAVAVPAAVGQEHGISRLDEHGGEA